MSSIFLRVRRHKTTYFLETDPKDTVHSLKQKLYVVLNKERDLKDMRLLVASSAGAAGTAAPTGKGTAGAQAQAQQQQPYGPLEDSGVIEQLGLENDSVVYLVFWVSGDPNPSDGKWEPVEIPEYEPLGVEEEAAEEVTDGKGKAPAV
ncbi:hypothetical protein HK104_009433 [Borealophlyctis nickersoniae]|nr:hypothetical protein HK104_009433 [Borealophlyctis nickersoniae]